MLVKYTRSVNSLLNPNCLKRIRSNAVFWDEAIAEDMILGHFEFST